MKKYTLLNHVGNRHLSYIEYGKEILYNEKSNFRSNSKKILNKIENDDEILENIKITDILKTPLEEYTNSIVKIILFVTDQFYNGSINSQDTVFAGEIIKRKLSSIDVEIVNFNDNPTDEGQLIRFYSDYFSSFQNNDNDLIYLDAGGTPQQKSTIKLVLSEFHPQVKSIYISNVEGDGKKEIKNVIDDNKFENVEQFYVLKNIKSLVILGHYDSAYDLLIDNNFQKNKAKNYLELAKYQMLQVNQGINSQEEIFKMRKNNTLFRKECFTDFLKDNKYQNFVEGILRSYLFLLRERYSQFVLSFQITIENLMLELICVHNNKSETNSFKVDSILKAYFDEENIITTLPKQLEYIDEEFLTKGKLNEEEALIIRKIQNLNSSYKKFILKQDSIEKRSKHLDNLRNSVAHNGKNIKSLPKFLISDFYAIFDTLKLDRNYWDKINQKIFDNLFTT